MSVRVIQAVFDRYPHGGGEMLLALAIANFARDDGTHIFPSVNTLADKTRQSVRSVQYHLQQMLAIGWLKLTNEGDGRGGQHREYSISPEWLKGADFAPSTLSQIAPTPMSQIAPVGANDSKGGCNPLHPLYNRKEPSVNRQSDLTVDPKGSRLTDDWIFPKKFGDWAMEAYRDWTADFVRERGAKFRDHWSAVPGKAGLKTDWFATWRNFCRAEAEFMERKMRATGPTTAGAPWWSSEALILAEGTKRGLRTLPGESMSAYKGRIQADIHADSTRKPDADQPTVAVSTVAQPDKRAADPISAPAPQTELLVVSDANTDPVNPDKPMTRSREFISARMEEIRKILKTKTTRCGSQDNPPSGDRQSSAVSLEVANAGRDSKPDVNAVPAEQVKPMTSSKEFISARMEEIRSILKPPNAKPPHSQQQSDPPTGELPLAEVLAEVKRADGGGIRVANTASIRVVRPMTRSRDLIAACVEDIRHTLKVTGCGPPGYLPALERQPARLLPGGVYG